MHPALILYVLAILRPVNGPPPFFNAVIVPEPVPYQRNDWPMSSGMATPFPDCHCAGDVYRLGFAEGAASVRPTADFNGDGSIDSRDYFSFLELFWASGNASNP